MADQTTKNHLDLKNPIDYLIFGYLTADLTESGTHMGGTVAYAGLTGKALGLTTGIVTSFSESLNISQIKSLWIKNKESDHTTTFRNVSDGVNRTQYLYETAETLTVEDCPDLTPSPSIIHLGPLAREVDPAIINCYENSLKCLTPQGWFRKVTNQFKVQHCVWENFEQTLSQADIAVISTGDVQGDETIISEMASIVPILAVTENYRGARIYWNNDARFINAPEVKYEDDTGAGDIFSAAFFYRYFSTQDPWEAGRFAVLLASQSVTRKYLDSIPTREEIEQAKLELLNS